MWYDEGAFFTNHMIWRQPQHIHYVEDFAILITCERLYWGCIGLVIKAGPTPLILHITFIIIQIPTAQRFLAGREACEHKGKLLGWSWVRSQPTSRRLAYCTGVCPQSSPRYRLILNQVNRQSRIWNECENLFPRWLTDMRWLLEAVCRFFVFRSKER